MPLAYIGLGSNLGNGKAHLKEAWRILSKSADIMPLALSSPYMTKPVESKSDATKTSLTPCTFNSDQWFTNAVGVLETKLSAAELLERLLAVEQQMGRTRGQSADRIIDLDILYYDDLVLHNDRLNIPHPEMQNRLFVLAPLSDLAPDRRHPLLGTTSMQMRRQLSALPDQSVKKVSWTDNGDMN